MNRKRWFKNLIYLAIMFLIVLLRAHVIKMAKGYYSEAFQMNYYLLFLIVLINCLFGVLLGLEHLIHEIKTEGTWNINYPKLILIGLPSLYFSIANFSIYSHSKLFQYIFTFPLRILLSYDTTILYLCQLIFGYIVITSFYKENKKIQVDSISLKITKQGGS